MTAPRAARPSLAADSVIRIILGVRRAARDDLTSSMPVGQRPQCPGGWPAEKLLMPLTNDTLPANAVLRGRYRIVEPLGAGNMGAVYLAYDLVDARYVAVKQNTRGEEELRKQFGREAAVLRGLSHPSLPTVFEYFIEDGKQYLIMQYIGGEDLKQTMLRSPERFGIEFIRTCAGELLDALEYMHTRPTPVIHRDIKPANIKVTSDGKVYLLDFGLARGGTAPGSSAGLTVLGCTVDYASPEQILRVNEEIGSTLIPFLTEEELKTYVHGASEPRNDIYSLAATLYHLLTGVRPPNGAKRLAEVKSGRPDPLRPASELRPDIPLQVEKILMRGMALDKSKRTVSAAVMKELLCSGTALDLRPGVTAEEAGVIPTAAPVLPPAQPPRLYMLGPPSGRQEVELGDEDLIIGRTEGQLRLPADASVSPRHASIFRRGDQFFVRDLGSRGGVYKRIIKEAELFEGDVIMLADLEFTVHYEVGGLLRLEPTGDGAADHPYSINVDEIVIGTAPALHKFRRHPSRLMGPRQARLVRRPLVGRFLLVDESPNGTNFKKVQGEATLHAGDLLLIGTTFLSFGVNTLRQR
jgi:pSer/pThr/pTyr-binding forkhead associated (FHA) protein